VLALIKALSTIQVSLAVLKELRIALSRRKKKSLVPAGICNTMPAGGAKVPERSSSQLAGKRKSNEVASLGDSSDPANSLPAPTPGPAPLPATYSVTGEKHATCSRQLVPPEGGMTYAAALAVSFTLIQPSGSLNLTVVYSDPSESAVSFEAVQKAHV
jgi:hypothetical protein